MSFGILGLFISFLLLLIAMSVHEFSHGWVAYRLGDKTAKLSGRLTLNPLAHIDPLGTVILPLLLFITTSGRFVFGAAKPMPIDYRALKNPKRDIIWIGLSGPLANLLFAAVLSVVWRFLPARPIIDFMCGYLISINVILGVFNLVPIPPLDGSRILMGILPLGIAYRYASIEPYGFILVIVLVGLGMFDALVEPVVRLIFGITRGEFLIKMKTITVPLGKRSYPIIVGDGVIDSVGSRCASLGIGTDAYVVSNRLVRGTYGDRLRSSLKRAGISLRWALVPDTEKSKSFDSAARLCEDIAGYDRKKRIFIVAFGGGVVGDLAGFVAAVYKRGIPYVQVPTTLLAQVDSAIGGKTGVDLKKGKNLAGAFYQPKLVASDTGLLKTMGRMQLASGLAEVIKYAVIKDARLFAYLEKEYPALLAARPASLEYVVGRCSAIKAKIVAADEREERGLRTLLNFGHTLGHAIETAGGYAGYGHGQAVALGMLVACAISRRLGVLPRGTEQKIEALIRRVGLPVTIERLKKADILSAHLRDKKFIGPRNRLVLVRGIGSAWVKTDVPLAVIRQALNERFSSCPSGV